MPARKKATATAPATETTIKDAASKLGTTEQALRLALSHIRPDDFDTTKTLSSLDLEAVSKHLQQPQLPATATKELQEPTQADNSEKLTQQDSQPATEPTTNDPIGQLAEQPSQDKLDKPFQPSDAYQASLVEMLARQATQEIEAVDGLSRVKNAVILNNLSARDAELAQQIQERHSDRKHQIMGSIRDVAALAQDKPEVTQDDTDLGDEINNIIEQLGKSLVR
ncbi:hypothetical protein [Nodularia sp. UHCC 0506]|uniref:hypothetical protein n=1 Tax=Nodularia sp. UHCC 0506 TaxID=3110243 RepID=UPI002B20D508|nr:hypothetical protein [Nodularia sp. UHCC 0506]MEA5516568.1 hypothetical protein [Nodularia sp. UHCC 0506]